MAKETSTVVDRGGNIPQKAASTVSYFTIGAWLLPAIGAVVVKIWTNHAKAQAHGWFPGLGEMIYGSVALGVVALFCGMIAFFRHERWRWASAPIALAGLAVVLWFAGAVLLP